MPQGFVPPAPYSFHPFHLYTPAGEGDRIIAAYLVSMKRFASDATPALARFATEQSSKAATAVLP
jgi:hypothetical protein